jgi:hypothetical protein
MGCFPLRTHFEQQKQKPDYRQLSDQRYSKSVTIAALPAQTRQNLQPEVQQASTKPKTHHGDTEARRKTKVKAHCTFAMLT